MIRIPLSPGSVIDSDETEQISMVPVNILDLVKDRKYGTKLPWKTGFQILSQKSMLELTRLPSQTKGICSL